jgi:hypothetical protein
LLVRVLLPIFGRLHLHTSFENPNIAKMASITLNRSRFTMITAIGMSHPRSHGTPRSVLLLLLRQFSSKDWNGKGTDSASRSGPVLIKKTPRSAAAAKLRSTAPSLNGSTTDSTTGAVKHHPAHHYINGGTPCDPAPPPYNLAEYGEESLYTLVLLRHGESEWNKLNQYTGKLPYLYKCCCRRGNPPVEVSPLAGPLILAFCVSH